MCDVCRTENIDWKFANGPQAKLHQARLFRVYKNRVAVIKLCHIHAIELFIMGEERFLANHVTPCIELSVDKSKYSVAA